MSAGAKRFDRWCSKLTESSTPQRSDEQCSSCAVGIVAQHGGGQFCPFIHRRRAAGDALYQQADPADYVWFIREGTVELVSEGPGETAREERSAGQFVGIDGGAEYKETATCSTDAQLCGATREGFARWRKGGSET